MKRKEQDTYVDNTIATHISLCTGCGGIDLGLRGVFPSLRTILYVEIEAFNQANLVEKMQHGFLDAAPIWTDLKTIPVEGFRDKVFGISGGYPCQPFSFCGKRQGTEDQDGRHLWPYCRRAVRAIRPAFCFWENVEGHISLGLSTVISDMEEDGYKTTWGLFSAQVDAGAPHQRKRVFILGLREDVDAKILQRFCPELADPDHSRLEGWLGETQRGQPVEGRQPQREPATQGTCGEPVANTKGGESGESQAWNGRQGVVGGGKELGDTDRERLEEQHILHEGREAGGAVPLRTSAGELADTAVSGLERAAGQKLQEGGTGSTGPGREELADPDSGDVETRCGRPGAVCEESAGSGSSGDASVSSKDCGDGQREAEDVADTDSGGRPPEQHHEGSDGEAEGRQGDTKPSGGDKELADPNDQRPQGQRPEGDKERRAVEDVPPGLRSRAVWPARPGESQQWWEPPRTIPVGKAKPPVGGDSTGTAGGVGDAELYVSCDNRVDELRTLGNSVVPQCASAAFLMLAKKLIDLER